MAVYLNLELTDHCNIRCPMCSQSLRDLAHGEAPSFMSWDTWRRLLANLEGSPEEVHLCPHWLGEPTIHPDFDRMVEYAFAMNRDNRLFRSFKLHTNGVVMPPARSELLVRLAASPQQAPDTFTSVHWSFDAATAPTYRLVKGVDRYQRVADNLRAFVRAREAVGSVWPSAHIAFVVQPDNAHEAELFVQQWGALLDSTGRPWELTVDWPRQDRDAIYIRPLNCADQAAADALHARTCVALGIAEEGQVLRAAESF
jgi:molybdenum cofactor biosynthesis enzyme MoaA